MLKIAVLVSGSGSNLQSIIDACESGSINAAVKIVVSDRKEAFGLERAKRKGIRAEFLDSKSFSSREEHEKACAALIDSEGCGLICLAGYMRLVTGWFVRKYPGKIMNIHPALLPSFPGAHAHRDVLAYGAKVSGCTVHFVDEEMDSGPIIIQTSVRVFEGDTEETLGKRVLEQEHKAYPEAIKLFSEGRLEILGRKVIVR